MDAAGLVQTLETRRGQRVAVPTGGTVHGISRDVFEAHGHRLRTSGGGESLPRPARDGAPPFPAPVTAART